MPRIEIETATARARARARRGTKLRLPGARGARDRAGRLVPRLALDLVAQPGLARLRGRDRGGGDPRLRRRGPLLPFDLARRGPRRAGAAADGERSPRRAAPARPGDQGRRDDHHLRRADRPRSPLRTGREAAHVPIPVDAARVPPRRRPPARDAAAGRGRGRRVPHPGDERGLQGGQPPQRVRAHGRRPRRHLRRGHAAAARAPRGDARILPRSGRRMGPDAAVVLRHRSRRAAPGLARAQRPARARGTRPGPRQSRR